MKNLYLIRHAKSSWNDPDLVDYDRPLTNKGKLGIAKMATWLNENQYYPDLILTSKANRAKKTARIIADGLNLDTIEIIEDRNLYECSHNDLIKYIKKLDDKYKSVFIIGHNPALTKLVNQLMQDFYFENIVTSGVVGLIFQTQSWANLSRTQADLLFYQFPKNF